MQRLLQPAQSRVKQLSGSPRGHAALAVLDQGIVSCGRFAVVALTGRVAGASQLGYLTLAFTLYYLTLAIQESLISVPYTVFFNKCRSKAKRSYFTSVYCQHLLLAASVSSIAVIGSGLLYFFSHNLSAVRIGLCLAIFAPVAMCRELVRRQMFTEMKISGVLRMTVVDTTVLVIAMLGLALTDHVSAATSLLAMTLSSAAAVAVWRTVSMPEFRTRRRRFYHSVRRHWRLGRWSLASVVASLTARQSIPWIIAAFLGPAETGAFAACNAILNLSNPLVTGFLNILTPHAALGLERGGVSELHRIVCRATAMLGTVMTTFFVVVAFAGEWLLQLIFGEAFAAYGTVLTLLVLTQLVANLAMGPNRGLLVLERTEIQLRVQLIGLVISLASALVLTPRYEIAGAAAALLIGRCVSSSLTMLAYRSQIAEHNERHPRPTLVERSRSA